jgi:hypothetical protein
MPFSFAEPQEPSQVLVIVSGDVSMQEVMNFIATSRNGDQRQSAFLFDVTAASLSLSGDEMRQIATYAAEEARKAPMGPVAFISAAAGAFGLSRVFQAYSAVEGRRNVGVFRTLADAQAWLAALKR